MQTHTPMLRFDAPPPFTKQIIFALLGLFVVLLIVENWIGIPLRELLAWHPEQIFARPWQAITHFLYQGTRPINFLFELLSIYFFLPPMQRNYGKKGIYRLSAIVLFVTAFFGALSIVLGAIAQKEPALGIGPFVTAMIVVFGLTNPRATILLIVFPIQAAWIAWGTGLLAALGFLSTRSLPAALWLAGWIAGYAFIELQPGGKIRRFFIRRKHQQTHKRLHEKSSRKKPHLTVHTGGKDETFH